MYLLNVVGHILADSAFVELFADMNPWSIVLFILGILFVGIETLVPGFGFFGIGGTAMIVVAIILRMINGGSAIMLLYMIVIVALLYVLMFLLLGKLIKNGAKNKNSIFNSDSSVPVDKTEGTKDFGEFVGKTGVAVTTLHPVGKALIDGQIIDVVARDGFVAKDAQVTVTETEGQRVVVIEK